MANRIPASKHGWQQKASDAVENSFLAQSIWPTLAPPEQALQRSQQGWQVSRTVVCLSRRKRCSSRKSSGCCSSDVWQPLPMSSFTCRCGRPLNSRGHHRAACPLAGVLGRRGFSLESAAAHVCREAGGRVTTNVRVQDMDVLPLHYLDNRRLEVVVDGLPLFRGAQLAIDTTMVSAVQSDGTARRRKERTHPELAQPHGRVRLVVLGCEVGGRWSEVSPILGRLATTKARSEPEVMRKSTMHNWLRRWSTLMACTAARTFALSLLERRCCTAADGPHSNDSRGGGGPLPRQGVRLEGAVGFLSADF